MNKVKVSFDLLQLKFLAAAFFTFDFKILLIFEPYASMMWLACVAAASSNRNYKLGFIIRVDKI